GSARRARNPQAAIHRPRCGGQDLRAPPMIRVLVVDDSAVMRAFLSRVIGAQPDMELLGASPDPLLAIDRIRRNPPDVITLDVEMPRMNGLDFLRNLMAMRPLPVIMISSLTRQGAETTMR